MNPVIQGIFRVMRRKRALAIAVFATFMVGSAAQGAIVEHRYSGELTVIQGDTPAPWDVAAIGTPWSVRYWFDTEAPDIDSNTTSGIYEGIWGEVTIAGITMGTGAIDLEVMNDGIGGGDSLIVTISDLGFDLINAAGIALQDANAIPTGAGDAVPIDIDLDDWDSESFSFQTASSEPFELLSSISGPIDTFSSRIVPAPGALSIILLGIFSPKNRRRKADGLI